ncbi:YjcZ family sporulation protein [Neobacillus sp. NPDC058068]
MEVLNLEEFRHERRENNVALVVTLFVLLIVVGASFMSGY